MLLITYYVSYVNNDAINYSITNMQLYITENQYQYLYLQIYFVPVLGT